MSEKKGPFEEAMRVLCSYRNEYAQKTSPLCAFLDNQGITDAIRVLEAAGRVDKANALESLKDAIENGEGGTGNYIRGLVESRALLEALPESGKEEK